MKKLKIYTFLLLTLITLSYLSINFLMDKGNFSFLKMYLKQHQINLIKKYIFPYKTINQNEKIISRQKNQIINQQSEITNLEKIIVKLEKVEDVKLTNDKSMKKYQLKENFYTKRPGGYIDFHLNTLIILSSAKGILGYVEKKNDEIYFKLIENNINDLINLKKAQKKHIGNSLKDLMIKDNTIFISYTEEIKENCWNTSIMYGEMSYTNIEFKKLFSSNECIVAERGGWESGGRIVNFKNNHILFSVGTWGSHFLAQEKKNINGKIISINIQNSEYQVLSMGHRNPQGLNYDQENNFILTTEHGPIGGDEINLIPINKIRNNEPLNFGWAIVSEGEHYCSNKIEKQAECADIYKKYPLYKSHSQYGFLEPLKSFTPSIGISEIVKISKNKYIVSSLKDRSLFYFKLNSENKIMSIDRIEVNERIRDLKIKNNNLYLFLDDTSSIGIISLDS